MKLIFLYGPPAAGKLTVARAIAAATGYRLFHNHLTVDLVASLFDFGTEPYIRFVRRLRLECLEVAAQENLAGLIFTLVYSRAQSDAFVNQVLRLAEERSIETHFVYLFCRQEVLEARVVAPDRAAHGKIATVAKLRQVVSEQEPYTAIPYVESLAIDNAQLSSEEAAERIITHYRLRPADAEKAADSP